MHGRTADKVNAEIKQVHAERQQYEAGQADNDKQDRHDAENFKVLDDFKQGRYLDVEGSYTESDLLNEILKERKLEFYHEQDMWWLDMKRLQTRMERIVNGTMYILEPDDFRYSLPIPQNEMSANKNMVQNPGWNEISL